MKLFIYTKNNNNNNYYYYYGCPTYMYIFWNLKFKY